MRTSSYLPPRGAPDIHWISNDELISKVAFSEEVGHGNWGSIWKCHYRSRRPSAKKPDYFAAKTVFLCKKHHGKDWRKLSQKRAKALWHELRLIKSFDDDPHPSIIKFDSYLVTPRYAMIIMEYLPTLIPVGVPELQAKPWFNSLLSAVVYMHNRGIVHNDIKPANILLNFHGVPVFVDFGFAEMYNVQSPTAFISKCYWNTPEYVSPERGIGVPHDTRKSDVWSLGVTFFEILTGRTPFEVKGEVFETREDLRKYWLRTSHGQWEGEYDMSKSLKKLLEHMITPNADLRYNAVDATEDQYWRRYPASTDFSHKRSFTSSPASSPSIALNSRIAQALELKLPWSPPASDDEEENDDEEESETVDDLYWKNLQPGKPQIGYKPEDEQVPTQKSQARHARSQSQPKLQLSKEPPQAPKRKSVNPGTLDSPPRIKGLRPVSSIRPQDAKENKGDSNLLLNFLPARRPFSAQPALSPISQNLHNAAISLPADKLHTRDKRASNILKDLTSLNSQYVGQPTMVVKSKSRNKENAVNIGAASGNGSVRKRMGEWERDRERIKEMDRLEAFGKQRNKELELARFAQEQASEDIDLSIVTIPSLEQSESIQIARVGVRASAQMMPATPSLSRDFSHTPLDASPRSVGDSALSGLKHSMKLSIDKGVRIYKSSGLARMAPSRGLSTDDADWSLQALQQQAWDDQFFDIEDLGPEEDVNGEEPMDTMDTMDRMTLWMRNVDKVVEKTKEEFANTSMYPAQVSLPIPPNMSRSSSRNRTGGSSRLPRKVLAASQIFVSDGCAEGSASLSASVNSTGSSKPAIYKTLPPIPSEDTAGAGFLAASTPPRPRRNTVTSRSPEAIKTKVSFDIDTGSPSKRKSKSKSQGNLLRPIQTIEKLELELQKEAMPAPSPRLSAFLDPSLFIASPISPKQNTSLSTGAATTPRSKSFDINHLTSSPVQIDPYPARRSDATPVVIDSPQKRRIEGVYDRFLMATSGVKRVGRGYQSENFNTTKGTLDDSRASSQGYHHNQHHNHRVFNTARRAMPPPVSSDDLKVLTQIDEFGVVSATPNVAYYKDDSKNTVALVRRAFKAVTGKTANINFTRTAAAC